MSVAPRVGPSPCGAIATSAKHNCWLKPRRATETRTATESRCCGHHALVLTARSYRRTVTPSLVIILRLAESWSRRQVDVLQPEECKMGSNQGGGSEQSGGSERQGEADKKGGQQSQEPSESGSKQQSGGSQRGGSGNFANDPERA